MASMTRKHFAAVAAILAAENEQAQTDLDDAAHGFDEGFASGKIHVLANVAESLADFFSGENPNFDRAKFLTACGV